MNNNESESIVVVGSGHAALQLCAGLVEAGLGARVQLVAEEDELPYHRPPLSKVFLKTPAEALQSLRAEAWFADSGITVQRGDAAAAIDREHRVLRLRSGRELHYGRLVLATGSRARRLHSLPEGLVNVAALRHAADARVLRERLHAATRLTVLGGGFIGLEIAATARALGKEVTVLEAAPRLLQRSVSPEIAAFVLDTHCAAGIDVRLGVAVGEFEIVGPEVRSLGVDGQREPVELLVLGIGASPEQALAMAAGLPCEDGIVVDACMRTADPHILAIGDCTRFPDSRSGRHVRLESVQNANDQARCAVATLLGREEPYRALPWFWSEQGSLRLQMAGLVPAEGTRHHRPGATATSFSILHYAAAQLVCVESVNAPLEHLMARKLLEAGRSPDPRAACDPATPLKTFL